MYDSTEIWSKYQKGLDHHRQSNLISQSQKNIDFFEGRQWRGIKGIDESELPVYNIIRQIVGRKYNLLSMADIDVSYQSKENEEYSKMINKFSESLWEKLKMYKNLWRMNKEAHIGGDSYIYIPDINTCQILKNVNTFLSDEQNPNLQEQRYIIISERLFVDDVKEVAKANGLDTDMIVSDEENETDTDKIEVKSTDGKCTSLLYIYKKDGIVHSLRAVKNLVYVPETNNGLTLYPIANYIVNEKMGTSRGIGEVEPLIPNQILLNKNLKRRADAIAQTAYPKIVYNQDLITNPGELTSTGGVIKLRNSNANKINEMVAYLQPSYVGNDAKELTDELVTLTKEVNNSGNGALGQVNPERASGTAIQAVTQQANISSNEQQSSYYQLVEDIGLILLELWKVQNPNGMMIEAETTDEIGNPIIGEVLIPVEILEQVNIKINVSPATPFDRLATDQQLKELLATGMINFNEFVESLDENTMFPKNKLEEIIAARDELNQLLGEKDMIIQEQANILAKHQMDNIDTQLQQEQYIQQ